MNPENSANRTVFVTSNKISIRNKLSALWKLQCRYFAAVLPLWIMTFLTSVGVDLIFSFEEGNNNLKLDGLGICFLAIVAAMFVTTCFLLVETLLHFSASVQLLWSTRDSLKRDRFSIETFQFGWRILVCLCVMIAFVFVTFMLFEIRFVYYAFPMYSCCRCSYLEMKAYVRDTKRFRESCKSVFRIKTDAETRI